MKTIKTYIPVLALLLVIVATGILKAQPSTLPEDHFLKTLFMNQPEEKVAPLPFNAARIASEALFQKLEENYFLNEQQEKVAPLPAEVKKMTYRLKLEKAWKLASVTEEEPQINDLPPAVKQFIATYTKKCLVLSGKK